MNGTENKEACRHISCATDDNYAQHCGVMLCSLFENNSQSRYIVHILMNEATLSADNRKRLQRLVENYHSQCVFHNVDCTKIQGMPDREVRPLGAAAYYRLLYASILDSSIHSLLYLYCDLVVNGNIDALFNLDLGDYALAAVLDSEFYTDEHRMEVPLPYRKCMFNSGVMLINLDYWREHNVEDKLLHYARVKRKYCLHDQDALNAVFHNNWLQLAPKWNKFNSGYLGKDGFLTEEDRQEYIHRPVIIHYLASLKPWEDIPGLRYRELYYKYLNLTEWKGFIPRRRPGESYMGVCKMIFFSNMKLWLAERNLSWMFRLVWYPLVTIKRILFFPVRILGKK